MDSFGMESVRYAPGWLAKISVVVAAGLYFVGLYYDSRRGADLNQAAFLQLLVPFVFVIPAAVIGHVTYYISRRSRIAGDIAFSVTMLATCIEIAIS